jgi:hypothetical protein
VKQDDWLSFQLCTKWYVTRQSAFYTDSVWRLGNVGFLRIHKCIRFKLKWMVCDVPTVEFKFNTVIKWIPVTLLRKQFLFARDNATAYRAKSWHTTCSQVFWRRELLYVIIFLSTGFLRVFRDDGPKLMNKIALGRLLEKSLDERRPLFSLTLFLVSPRNVWVFYA